jgi:D-lactate dehydrogenase (cytochrome)
MATATTSSSATAANDAIVRQLQQLVGVDNVLTDEADRRFYSTDLSWRPGEIAQAVIRPGSV